MLCSFDRDYRAYQAAYDEDEARQAYEDMQQKQEIEAALASCNPNAKVVFFETVDALVNDCLTSHGKGIDELSNAVVRALLEAARDGKEYAIKALETVADHYYQAI